MSVQTDDLILSKSFKRNRNIVWVEKNIVIANRQKLTSRGCCSEVPCRVDEDVILLFEYGAVFPTFVLRASIWVVVYYDQLFEPPRRSKL